MRRILLFTISVPLFFMAFSAQLKAQVPGKGLLFDGDDDYVNVPTTTSDELNPTESLTLECWVYLNEVPSGSHTPHLISRFNCYSLTVGANGLATAFIQNDEGDWFSEAGTTTITTSKWYHLAATYDGSNLRVFVNGEQEGITTAYDTMARTTLNFRIGARNAYVTNTNTNGIIDEARVWDIARTQAEIQGSMNRTIPGSTPGLVGYWRFDEGSGTTANCETSYGNDGTLRSVSTPSLPDWITSTASMGESSLFAESADIAESSDCAVDVDFGSSGEGPGAGRSMAVMQVNEFPNSVSGLYEDRASEYWEIWSEDPDFDGDFMANVRFHYDDISGLPRESSLELFRRENAAGNWTAVTGYTVVTDDGGSSTATDGIGYVELPISENSAGVFSGQFILSWSDASPVISDIPDQTVAEGTAFATINLDDYVADPDHTDEQITWTIIGEDDVTVTITDRVATITPNDPEWNGTDVIRFTATDPEGEFDEELVTFEVTVVYDPPVVGDIPDQEIAEGASFATITLDDFVTDVDDPDSNLTWTTAGETDLSVDITDRVATISMPNTDWNGNERITFTVEDTSGLTDFVHIRFIVTAVNDTPMVAGIPDQTIAEGQSFSQVNLDDFVTDPDDVKDSIAWTVAGQSDITVSILDRVATFTMDPEWNGSETIIFTATDTAGAAGGDTCILKVTGINDAPFLSKTIPDTSAGIGTAFLFVLDPNTFTDIDPGDVLVLNASTPAWLTFDPATGTFSGTPMDADKGLLEVVVTATDGSSASVADTFNINVESYVGISNQLEGLEINLYPNPNNGRFVIEGDRFELRDVVLEIFNDKGQLIWNREIRDGTGSLHESVDLNNAAAGLYLLRVRNRSAVINTGFIISF